MLSVSQKLVVLTVNQKLVVLTVNQKLALLTVNQKLVVLAVNRKLVVLTVNQKFVLTINRKSDNIMHMHLNAIPQGPISFPIRGYSCTTGTQFFSNLLGLIHCIPGAPFWGQSGHSVKLIIVHHAVLIHL